MAGRRRWCPSMALSSRGSVPREEGEHRCPGHAFPCTESILFVFFAHPESPLQFYVNYPNSGSVSAYGPGLVYGVANKTATFTIVTEDAGEGTVACGWFCAFCFPFENPGDTVPGQPFKKGCWVVMFIFFVSCKSQAQLLCLPLETGLFEVPGVLIEIRSTL